MPYTIPPCLYKSYLKTQQEQQSSIQLKMFTAKNPFYFIFFAGRCEWKKGPATTGLLVWVSGSVYSRYHHLFSTRSPFLSLNTYSTSLRFFCCVCASRHVPLGHLLLAWFAKCFFFLKQFFCYFFLLFFSCCLFFGLIFPAVFSSIASTRLKTWHLICQEAAGKKNTCQQAMLMLTWR